ncbi:MAG: M23 family metallopeptidase [Methanobacteriaceae archaeon]|nr:M23 family metallopeptidase [Methanobacteriaceae archaeon]
MKDKGPIPIESPLKGEWMVLNSPGTKVPSHGTDYLAQTYAFDLLQVDWVNKPLKFYKKSTLSYILGKVHLSDCYCYGKPIYAPISGTVVEARDGYPERDPVQPIHDISIALKNALFFNPDKQSIQDITGNYIIIQGDKACAFLGHLQKGSIKVKKGDQIKTGDLIGNIGHSGNSTAPHLHFQLMDGPDPIIAKGLPCCFREYELYDNGHWIKVENGIPKNKDRVRF